MLGTFNFVALDCCCIRVQLIWAFECKKIVILAEFWCKTSTFDCNFCWIWMHLLLHSNAPVVAFECNCCCIQVHLLLHSSATAAAFVCTCCCIRVQLLLHLNALLHSLCATLPLSVPLLLCLCVPLFFSASVKPLNTLPLSAVNVHLPLHYLSYASTLYCCTCYFCFTII